jgi:energy-coupling factor transport system ATP-binding protein
VIRFADVSFTYAGASAPTLDRVDLEVGEGELCLVVGPTGSGKSTLLGAIDGLVPHFTGGRLSGSVTVDGRSTRDHPPRELADVVGVVGQDPASGFVTDTVEDELAYAMENLGVPPAAMRRRIEDALDLLSLHELRDRALVTLSGGQQQRVAIGAVLTAAPRVLVLDEPTSALDPAAAEEVLAALTRLVHDLGLTVVLAEHRLERVLPFADRMVLVPGGGAVVDGRPADVVAHAPVAPPLVELARLAGWTPVPLSVRDARRLAGPLRGRLAGREPVRPVPPPADDHGTVPVAELVGVTLHFDEVRALDGVDLAVAAGEVVAVMGRNGSGKSTLLGALAGLRTPGAGSARVLGRDPVALAARDRIGRVGLVPQDAGLLLYGETVGEECAAADGDAGLPAGTTAAVLEGLLPGLPADRHPGDLSEGQRLAVVLALVVAPGPSLVLLDEPTRGLDYAAKERLVEVVAGLAADGRAVVIATHDVELAARVAHRVVVLADGEVVADGETHDVVCHSPVFAPQVAKVLAPAAWLTVDEVRSALAEAPRAG